jgi:hypothetical protein
MLLDPTALQRRDIALHVPRRHALLVHLIELSKGPAFSLESCQLGRTAEVMEPTSGKKM